ncbi:MAG: YeeE/YedE family protein [Rhizobiales bacterium]|nr:YeeE/YedE family protein [Hyphomicrobiales bacterium]MBI3672900.1 YeeE/YedE family protein [Hyphomicrobiales bacterium]
MTEFAPLHGLIGGALIGLAAVLLMLTLGRIAGVSTISFGLLAPADSANRPWRLAFLVGLPLGALLVTMFGLKDWSTLTFPASVPVTIVAGLLVGIGTTYGSGCTSGHGVCGLARLSPRSLVATITFVAVAAITVFIFRHLMQAP